MSTSQFISVREAAQILAISEKKIMDLIEARTLQAYRIANKFLRLKRSEVLELRNSGKIPQEDIQHAYTPAERASDFFYYNNFYLFSGGMVVALLVVIFLM